MNAPNRSVLSDALVLVSASLVLVLASATGNAAPIAPPAPNTTWLLDEGAGTLLADYDSPRSGVLGGTPAPTYSTNTPFAYDGNRSLQFVSSGSAVGNWAEINGHPSGTQGTVAFWVADDGGTNSRYILDATDGHRTLLYRSPGSPPQNINAYLNQSSLGAVSDSAVPTDGTWTHIAIVWDNALATEKQKVYRNGVLFQTFNVTVSAKNPASVFLGSRFSRNETWGGRIDEYALWDVPLSPDHVEWLAGNSLRDIPRDRPSAPSAAWLFDEGSGTTAQDYIGSNDGTLHGGVTWSTHTPYAMYLGDNHSLRFDGATGSYVSFGPHSFGAEGSIQMWVYRDTTDNNARYVMDTDGARTLLYRSGTVWALHMNGTSLGTLPDELIDPFQWTHLTFTWDNSLATAKEKVYKNGDLFQTFNTTLSPSSPSTIFLGSRQSLNENWLGWIDEFALFDRALSGYEIEQFYRYSLVGIPEPGTFFMLGCGGLLVGLAWRRRKRPAGR